MKKRKVTKSESIKFRITKEEKEKLIRIAESRNESLSSYILKRSLQEYPDTFRSLPQIIDTNNLVNEIYHMVKRNGNEALMGELSSLLHKHISNSGRKE